MKYFKKYPLFFIVMAVLLLAFAGTAGYDFYLNSQRGSYAKTLNREMNSYNVALADDPTKAAIDASDENIAKLEGHLQFLEKDLTRASTDIFKKLTAKEGYQLVEQLRGFVNSWRKDAAKLDITVAPNMDFGFKKYVAPNADSPKDEAIPAIWKQACVLNYINKKLFACKSEKSPMWIISVQREILDEEGVKVTNKKRNVRGRRIEQGGDNFKIDAAITARKDGSLDTLAYKFTFAGHTDVLRRFLNQLKDFDAMLVVRSIDVKPADPAVLEQMKAAPEDSGAEGGGSNSSQGGLAAIFGAAADNAEQAAQQAAAQPAEGAATQQAVRTPVVTDNISEFTVVIEYVEVVKQEEPAKGEKNASAKTEDKE